MRSVLVVDDDPLIRQLIQDVLECEGVLDVMMPGLSGHEVLARLRAEDPMLMLPVVMLTAAADDAKAWQAWQAWQAWIGGGDYFLAVPFDAAELLRYLDQRFSGIDLAEAG